MEDREYGHITLRWTLWIHVVMKDADRTGSESCPVAEFDISSVEPSGSVTIDVTDTVPSYDLTIYDV
jgi:hypothetical protein